MSATGRDKIVCAATVPENPNVTRTGSMDESRRHRDGRAAFRSPLEVDGSLRDFLALS
jgi:hypothetical protein